MSAAPSEATAREAACSCGQLRASVRGTPLRISVCHCLDCQRRSGSAFAAQARFPEADVRISGRSTAYTRIGDEGRRATFHFCPDCGATVHFAIEAMPGLVAIPLGAFADPGFPPPTVSNYEERRHAWVGLPETFERPA